MCGLTIVTFSFLMCGNVLTASIDQRQTGDMNVQIDLKNLNIFALTKGKEEYVDYDYAYDYSEMTIKPQNGSNKPHTSTTIKPLNTTETVTQTEKDGFATELATTSIPIENSSLSTEEASSTEKLIAEQIGMANYSSIFATTTVKHDALNDSGTENQTLALTECKKGFFRNYKGICELKLQNPSNVLLKMLQQSKSHGVNGHRKS